MDERSIFLSAIQRSTPEEQRDYLDAACSGDPALRGSVEALLRAHAQAGSFLDIPPLALGEIETSSSNAANTPHEAAPHSKQPPDEPCLDFLAPAPRPGQLGSLGGYEVTEVIGRGGMGIVLKAFDPRLGRVVAIKVLAPELASNAMARKRFLREAQAAAAINHDHVVTIYAIDETNRLPYLVMEFVAGLSLEERIEREGPLKLQEILRIGKQIAAGLAAAHAEGLVHRDIKPANILLENGIQRVKITDFGLARAVDDVAITQTGVVAGTPLYMAPEQARGGPIDHRSDLFSLGSVMYAMCTGRAPFRAESTMAVLRRVCEDKPRPIREINPDVPGWLVPIVERLLAKDPAARIQSAGEVADLLNRHLAHLNQPAGVPMPPPLPALASPPVRPRQRWASAFALVGLLLVLAAGVALWTRFGDPSGGITATHGTGPNPGGAGAHLNPSPEAAPAGEELSTPAALREPTALFVDPSSPAAARALAIPPHYGRWLVVGREEGTVELWDLFQRKRIGSHVLPRAGQGSDAAESARQALAFSPTGLRLAGAVHPPARSSADGTAVHIWPVVSAKSVPQKIAFGNATTRQVPEGGMLAIGFSQREELRAAVASAEQPGELLVWNLDAGRLAARLAGAGSVEHRAFFSPDAAMLLAAGREGELRVWHIPSGRQMATAVHGSAVDIAAFSPAGDQFASAGGANGSFLGRDAGDHLVLVWPQSGKAPRAILAGHRARVGALAYSPGGRLLASGDADGMIKLWRAATGELIASFPAHAAPLTALVFTPDSGLLASAADESPVKLWDVGELLPGEQATSPGSPHEQGEEP